MRLIAVETGRATWLFPLEEITPLEPMDRGQLTAALVERYRFGAFPADNIPAEELNKNGAKFHSGFFDFNGTRAIIGEVAIFNDGIVVNSNSTEAAEAFIQDLMSYVRTTFKFRDFTSRVRKIIVSQLIVEFDTRLTALVPLFEKISELIVAETGELYGEPIMMDFGRLDLQMDKEKTGLDYAAPKFLIERRAGVPFSQERYYCSASMHSESHFRILGEIEKMLLT